MRRQTTMMTEVFKYSLILWSSSEFVSQILFSKKAYSCPITTYLTAYQGSSLLVSNLLPAHTVVSKDSIADRSGTVQANCLQVVKATDN